MTKNTKLWRTLISIVLGLLIIIVAWMLRDRIVAAKKAPEVRERTRVNKVFVQEVKNSSIPVDIVETGNLRALRKVEIYAEVQGILESRNKLFKPGQSYASGETILKINADEFISTLTAQKSMLYNQIAQAMPDLKLDYPEAFPKWEAYLNSFDINGPVPALPGFSSDREKYFINNRNIITSYYNIRNLEERLKKFTIRAPFYSVVTEALVVPGALVRSGQKLGTILNPAIYEMPVSVDATFSEYISMGKKVTLSTLDGSGTWSGKIARIDPSINTETQGIVAYIEVRGDGLKEGMFLQATIEGNKIEKGFEISRKLLVSDNSVFAVQGDTLALLPVEIALYRDRTAIITNLDDSTKILKNAIPGAYEGMVVEIIDEPGI